MLSKEAVPCRACSKGKQGAAIWCHLLRGMLLLLLLLLQLGKKAAEQAVRLQRLLPNRACSTDRNSCCL